MLYPHLANPAIITVGVTSDVYYEVLRVLVKGLARKLKSTVSPITVPNLLRFLNMLKESTNLPVVQLNLKPYTAIHGSCLFMGYHLNIKFLYMFTVYAISPRIFINYFN